MKCKCGYDGAKANQGKDIKYTNLEITLIVECPACCEKRHDHFNVDWADLIAKEIDRQMMWKHLDRSVEKYNEAKKRRASL